MLIDDGLRIVGLLHHWFQSQCFTTKSMIKKHLEVMQYSRYLHEVGAKVIEDKNDNLVCIVCMNCIEETHQVRVPCNCNNLFHKECLDVLVDQGKDTCPLCRSKLLLAINQEYGEDDPWRFERIIYLFGDDFEFLGYQSFIFLVLQINFDLIS